jgi:hypothetical protein
MTLGDLAIKARSLVNADTTSWTDAQLLIDFNIWYQKIVSMILESVDESDFDDARNTTYPIKTTSLGANQRDYSIPVSEKVLKIKRVDVTYDGTNWYRASPIDDGEIQQDMGANQAVTDNNFIQTNPRYDVKYNSIFLYPAPVSTTGSIRIEWTRNITPFTTADYTTVLTDSTVVPGFDDPFHPMLAYGPSLDYAISKQLPQLGELQPAMVDWETRLRQHYSRKELDRVFMFKPVYDDSYGR